MYFHNSPETRFEFLYMLREQSKGQASYFWTIFVPWYVSVVPVAHFGEGAVKGHATVAYADVALKLPDNGRATFEVGCF